VVGGGVVGGGVVGGGVTTGGGVIVKSPSLSPPQDASSATTSAGRIRVTVKE
jgi:hypothetical protein